MDDDDDDDCVVVSDVVNSFAKCDDKIDDDGATSRLECRGVSETGG